MHLVAVILGVLLFPKALSALKCYECIPAGTGPGACNETQRDCPASLQCGALAATVRSSAVGMDVDVKMKSCLPSAECGLSGSMNFGFSSAFVSTCCSTALCNDQYPSPPAGSFLPNGKKCYTCTADSKNCSSILPCSGHEDRCLSTRVEYGGIEMTMKGCVSKSLCEWSSVELPGMSASVSCCEGDLCNSATSTAVSLLLLAAPLVSVALFN